MAYLIVFEYVNWLTNTYNIKKIITISGLVFNADGTTIVPKYESFIFKETASMSFLLISLCQY